SLRIAYKLDRFSEDMDFTLLKADKKFDISPYLKGVEDELAAFGLNLKAEKKIKSAESVVESAFLKGNTHEHLLSIEGLKKIPGIHKDELIKIKVEIDTDPPASGQIESKIATLPIPFSYQILSLP